MTSHAVAGSPPTASWVVTTTHFARVRRPARPATPPRMRLTHIKPLGGLGRCDRRRGLRRLGLRRRLVLYFAVDPQRRADLGFDLERQFRVVGQELFGVVAPLAEPGLAVGE